MYSYAHVHDATACILGDLATVTRRRDDVHTHTHTHIHTLYKSNLVHLRVIVGKRPSILLDKSYV